MRRLTSRVAGAVRASVRRLPAAQGVAGVLCVAAGAYLLAGAGVALVVVGGFLLLGAWGAR